MELGVIDRTGELFQPLANRLKNGGYEVNALPPSSEKELKQNLKRDYDGILVIPEDVFENNLVIFYFKDLQGMDTDKIRYALDPLVVKRRLQIKGYEADEILKLTAGTRVDLRSLEEKEMESAMAGIFLPMGLAMLMVFAAVFTGGTLLQSISKEKNNRIAEILFSSVSAKDLMYGKIIGFGILSLVQIIIWAGAGLFAATRFFEISLTSLWSVKTIYMLGYFVFGFLLIAGLNAIAGAAAKDNSAGNQSSVSSFIALIPVVPLWLMAVLINSPEGSLTRAFTYIPFFTPTTMLVRLGISSPDLIEILLSLGILIITDYILIRLAVKIFRVGMLMYGKKISFKELIRWSRVSE